MSKSKEPKNRPHMATGGRADKPVRSRRPKANVGVRDVARVAGVSTATVSRAVNTPDRVSTELRERIQTVSRDLGWVPDGAARALTTRRSRAIGAVFPTIAHGDFARATEALQEELRQNGYTFILACCHSDPEQEFQLVRQFVEQGVDALVLVGAEHQPELTALLDSRGLPYVNTFVYDKTTHGTCIGPDNRKALAELTEYLVRLGHRNFGVIAQELKNNDRAVARLQGIRDTLKRHKIELHDRHVVEGRCNINQGRALFRHVMSVHPVPTVVMCGNSYLAVGAMLEALSMGIKVPEDLSIVGYDDIEVMSELSVPITTLRVRSDEVGQRAAQLLMAKLEGRSIQMEWECETEIVVRASSGPPPLPRQLQPFAAKKPKKVINRQIAKPAHLLERH